MQVLDVAVAHQEPEQLMDDRTQVELFRRDARESLGEVEAHLVAENGTRADAGAVAFLSAVFIDMPQKCFILIVHGRRS